MQKTDELSGMSAPLPPIDLYGLRLLRLVAEHQSITAAAGAAGLTQSALTRQVQGMEQRLGVTLFERTTRRLKLTAAGGSLLRETARIPVLLEAAVRQIRESHLGLPRELRVGVSHSVSLAHLPGLLHAHLRKADAVRLTVSHLSGTALLDAVAQNRLDAAILGAPRLLPPGCRITHRMTDQFVMIAPVGFELPAVAGKRWTKALRHCLDEASWLMLPPAMQTRQDMDAWLRKSAVSPGRTASLDSFDLIIHLVALGLGVALVPRRALAPFPRKKQLQILTLPEPFERQLVVVTGPQGTMSGHVKAFVDSILFS
jgi:DNA-binding transcriptional LysR family regulator